MYESELRDALLNKMLEFNTDQLLIGKEVPVPYKHIYLPARNHKLEIWCFKQDIVIYEKLFDKSVRYRDARIIANKTELINVVLEKDSSQNSHHVGLPYVIIETKAKQPTTHEILTYSSKVQMIKSIFPYCKFVFLMFGKFAARTYRHGVFFDRILCIENIDNNDEIIKFKGIIYQLLDEVREDIRRINS